MHKLVISIQLPILLFYNNQATVYATNNQGLMGDRIHWSWLTLCWLEDWLISMVASIFTSCKWCSCNCFCFKVVWEVWCLVWSIYQYNPLSD